MLIKPYILDTFKYLNFSFKTVECWMVVLGEWYICSWQWRIAQIFGLAKCGVVSAVFNGALVLV